MIPSPAPFLLRTSYLYLFLLSLLYSSMLIAVFSSLPVPVNGILAICIVYSAYRTLQKQCRIQRRRHLWSITPSTQHWILGIGENLETDFVLQPESIITPFILVLRFKRKRYRTQRRTVLLFPDSFENAEHYREFMRYCRLLQAHR